MIKKTGIALLATLLLVSCGTNKNTNKVSTQELNSSGGISEEQMVQVQEKDNTLNIKNGEDNSVILESTEETSDSVSVNNGEISISNSGGVDINLKEEVGENIEINFETNSSLPEGTTNKVNSGIINGEANFDKEAEKEAFNNLTEELEDIFGN